MASTPITFAECRERHGDALVEALNDLKAAQKYDAPALGSDVTRVHRGLTGLADVISALAVVDMPETTFHPDRGFEARG